MASHTHSEPAKMEQIITEFFAKSLHIVLESRCPYVSSRHYSGEQIMSSPSPSSSSSSSSSIRPRDKWFNLALRDCSVVIENIDFSLQSNLEPLVVDVILVQRPRDWDPLSFSPKNSWNLELDEFGYEAKSEKIIERWFVQYETRKNTTKRSNCTSSHVLYKKSILLLRSLYATVRLLPAYKLFRDLNSSGQIREFNLAHRVSTFAEPLTRKEESEMQRFAFTPVDTACGRLSISVLYTSSLLDSNSEPTTPISPRFIPDYVGSPMADPLKRFPSIPVPQSSPPPLDRFVRRHSWSYDIYRASPPSVIPSPSPTYSDSRASISRKNNLPPTILSRHLSETPLVHMKCTSFDDFWPSPIFSPSLSSSPPTTYVQGSHISSRSLLRTESDPLSVAVLKQILPPSPTFKATRLGSKTDRSSGLVHTGSTADKLFSHGKDEIGRLYGLKLSTNSSLQRSFSRSSSRLSYQDDYDDSVFSGPFVVDDDDVAEPGGRPGGSPDETEPGGFFPVRKSKDAAVAALVHMLKKPPPLRQDISEESRNFLPQASSMSSIQAPELVGPGSQGVDSSSQFASKTTADALEELKVYREMKDDLLKQGGSSHIS